MQTLLLFWFCLVPLLFLIPRLGNLQVLIRSNRVAMFASILDSVCVEDSREQY
jgi:hypothetical protein